ncbi:MAG: SPW repeat protein [Bacteroidota bacterium]
MMKVLSWIIALLGLWEFGDITALFVPGFGGIPAVLWNHIIVGLILMIVGVWAARTQSPDTAKTMNWIASGAGLWLLISSFILRYPVINIGLWNDLIVGVIALVLGAWAAFTLP